MHRARLRRGCQPVRPTGADDVTDDRRRRRSPKRLPRIARLPPGSAASTCGARGPLAQPIDNIDMSRIEARPLWRAASKSARPRCAICGKRVDRHPRRTARSRGAGRHQARLDPRRNEAQLSRLRDERDREPRAAGRARRAEARAPPHPLRDARAQLHARPALQQVGAHRRRRDGQISSAWRPRDLRRAGAHGAGLLDARAADRRAGQFRLGRRRSARGVALHRGAP